MRNYYETVPYAPGKLVWYCFPAYVGILIEQSEYPSLINQQHTKITYQTPNNCTKNNQKNWLKNVQQKSYPQAKSLIKLIFFFSSL